MELSGAQWAAQFPTSKSLADLLDTVRPKFLGFIASLQNGSASVSIAATYRPPERAYLMHFCCQIAGYRDRDGAFHQIAPDEAPAMAGVDIDWTHGGDIGAARAAAVAMREAYDIAFPAALISRHTQRRAVDMTIKVLSGAIIKDAQGVPYAFHGSADGMDARVIAIGKTFGCLKLFSDPPHWSDDGH